MHKQLLNLFDKFVSLLQEYFGDLPVDLRMTLQDLRDYIERNKKNE